MFSLRNKMTVYVKSIHVTENRFDFNTTTHVLKW